MISTSNLTMQFAGKPLFENVSAKFESGKVYGLIGANGSGKSTFMKILSGKLEATSGNVNIPDQQRLASLSQDQFAFNDFSVLDAVIMGHKELWKVKEERDALYALPEMSEEQGMRAGDLEMMYAELDGYSAESRAGELLLGVEIPLDLHYKKMGEIPPGLGLRVLLTQVLFSDPDIMLLDEPTNNLDINTIRWLEGALRERHCTMIIISHDRHFLNSVCTHTADLDYGTIQLFPGNYDEYMVASTQARQRAETDQARKQAKIADLQNFVSRFAANASKGRQATSRLKQIEKLKVEELKPSSRKFPYIKFNQEKKLHRLAVEIKNLSNGYIDGELLFKDVDLLLEAGKKIAVIGPNGVGKTTFLKTILGEFKPKSGEAKWAESANISYLAQDHNDEFDKDMSLLDWMGQWGKPGDDEQVIRGALGRMLFSGDTIKKSIKVLSGGEKVRLLLGKFTLTKSNILVLDEPTNHLDMESIESLSMALEEFPGTVIIVSHDRQLISNLANEIVEIKPEGTYNYYQGNYDNYLASQK